MHLHVTNFSWEVHGLLNPTIVGPTQPKCGRIPEILVKQKRILDCMPTLLDDILLQKIK